MNMKQIVLIDISQNVDLTQIQNQRVTALEYHYGKTMLTLSTERYVTFS